MDLLLAGLAGVVVGAGVAAALLLHVFQRRLDRDLIERRLRACFEYREALGDLELAFQSGSEDPGILDQAWRNVELFAREVRRTGWLFEGDTRLRLEALAAELERASRGGATNGDSSGGRVAQLLCEKAGELDHLLRRTTALLAKEHGKIRLLPDHRGT